MQGPAKRKETYYPEHVHEAFKIEINWPDKLTFHFLSPYLVYPVQVVDLAQAAAAFALVL